MSCCSRLGLTHHVRSHIIGCKEHLPERLRFCFLAFLRELNAVLFADVPIIFTGSTAGVFDGYHHQEDTYNSTNKIRCLLFSKVLGLAARFVLPTERMCLLDQISTPTDSCSFRSFSPLIRNEASIDGVPSFE